MNIFQTIAHRLWGWDYVHWANMFVQRVARVHVDAEGNPFYWQCRNTRVLDKITKESRVVWLTCPPEKYLGDDT